MSDLVVKRNASSGEFMDFYEVYSTLIFLLLFPLSNNHYVSKQLLKKNFELSDVDEEQSFSKFDEDSFEPSGKYLINY